ncbi:MAG TPA: phage major capsid protein [Anaerolineae bacterium]|nr:phage major capsid protein [Anaerolineae bacterium]
MAGYTYLPPTLGGDYTREAAILSEYVARKGFDNISKKHFFSAWLNRKCMKGMPGGTSYSVPVSFSNSSNFAFVARMAELKVAMDDPVTKAVFNANTLAGTVTISQEDLADNAGVQGGVLDIMAESLASAERSIAEALSTALCTGDAVASATSLNGISHLVREDPTNTVGTLPRASSGPPDYTKYQNKHTSISDFSTELAAGGPNIIELIRSCSDGETTPNLILADETTWSNWSSQYIIQQDLTTVDKTAANMGFITLSWQGIPVAWDSHVNATEGGSIGSDVGVFYVLSSDALMLAVNRNQFKSKGLSSGDFVELPGQLALSAKMAWRGALCLLRGAGCGVGRIEAW